MELLKIRDLKDLQALLDLMQQNGLAELELEDEGQRIRLRKIEPRALPEASAGHIVSAAPAAAPAPGGAPGAEEASAPPSENLETITSPLVGTFYRAPSPEADPFVQEGDLIEEDTVVCIVEAMKVMNEIRSDQAGVVREILVKNGEPVEFGQALFRLEPR